MKDEEQNNEKAPQHHRRVKTASKKKKATTFRLVHLLSAGVLQVFCFVMFFLSYLKIFQCVPGTWRMDSGKDNPTEKRIERPFVTH